MLRVIPGGVQGGFVATLPALIKGRVGDAGQRLVEVEASVEEVDAEGDLILQSALLNSRESFLAAGHLDIDHFSEIGSALGIPNPMSWIVGRPTEVFDSGGGRTMVRGEIRRSAAHDPDNNKFDAFWDSLTSKPPVLWRASVFGYMGDGTLDCRSEACSTPGVTRFLVSKFDWRSLAFTRNPVNQGIKGFARVVSAKAFVEALGPGPLGSSLPGWDRVALEKHWADQRGRPSMEDIRNTESCPTCGGLRDSPSLGRWTHHFEKCAGCSPEDADLLGHAAYAHSIRRSMPLAVQIPALGGQ